MYFKMAPKDGAPQKPIPPQEVAVSSPDVMGGEEEAPNSPGSVDPSIAGYMGPEYGPFQCSNCVHFLSPNACQVVAGDIDPQGCCNIFTPGSENEAAEPPEQEASEDESTEQPTNQEGEY